MASSETAIRIEPSTRADAADIQAVARQAWEITYRDLIPAASRDTFLRQAYDLDFLQRLHARDDVRGFIARRGPQPVGFAMLSLGSPADDPPGAVLRSLYLLPEVQHFGCGRRLLQEVCAAARASGAPFLWVAVHSDLSAARTWYERQGFVYDGPAEILIGDAKIAEAVYRLPLGPESGSDGRLEARG